MQVPLAGSSDVRPAARAWGPVLESWARQDSNLGPTDYEFWKGRWWL